MPIIPTRSFWLGLLLLALTLMLDQLSKQTMLDILSEPHPRLIEVTGFFNITLVWNYGISFGMFAGRQEPHLLTFVSLAIVLILLIWLYKNSSALVGGALGCVMGGAIGNIIDRLRFGAVTDFLDFHVGYYHWPAFNLADSFIFIGVVLLCASSMLLPRQHHSGENAS